MNPTFTEALQRGGAISITMIGARRGLPRRIEINLHAVDVSYHITGRPGAKRDWLANAEANSGFTVHLKNGGVTDLAATAAEITDPGERADVLYRILTDCRGNEPEKAQHALPQWVDSAPLVKLQLT